MITRGPRKRPQITDFPLRELTPPVPRLLELHYQLYEEIQALRDANARLKVAD